ncbi:MAG: MotA/TolQ/ExbB proton channel family protein, partial [Acidobacteria bacterium]|nr:MotA/TolQ/ExbB proton channel family protein [Acidobacteriota bacterium]
MAAAKGTAGARLDMATLLGLTIASVGIVGGLLLEGGSVVQILSPTALLIVLGGTLGAVLVTTPMAVAITAAKALGQVFLEHHESPETAIEQIVGYATKARRNGIVSLEDEALAIEDPFLRKTLSLAVDGTDLQELRKMMELEIVLGEHAVEAQARVFESAGGYSPTIGIIGAVLGLIQVMQQLADIEKVGHGIATAF